MADPLDTDPLVVAAGIVNRRRCAYLTAVAGKVVDPTPFLREYQSALAALIAVVDDPATTSVISRAQAVRWAAGG